MGWALLALNARRLCARPISSIFVFSPFHAGQNSIHHHLENWFVGTGELLLGNRWHRNPHCTRAPSPPPPPPPPASWRHCVLVALCKHILGGRGQTSLDLRFFGWRGNSKAQERLGTGLADCGLSTTTSKPALSLQSTESKHEVTMPSRITCIDYWTV